MGFSSISALLIVLSYLASWNSFASKENVIGPDDRVIVKFSNKKKLPFSAIGMLENGEGNECTASLVGPDLLVTAAHCVLNEKNNYAWPITFHLQYNDGAEVDQADAKHVWVGTTQLYDSKGNYSDTSNDWALVQINKKLGNTYGWLGTRTLGWREWVGMESWFMLPGYSSDLNNKMGAALSCSIREDLYDQYFHDCDMLPGASGGSLISNFGGKDGWQVVAVNVLSRGDNERPQTYNWGTANGAVKASKFIPKLKQLLGVK